MECETMPVPQLSQISSALGRVDLDLIIPKFYVPLGRQLGEPVQIALLHLRVQPSLVKRVEVMADVPELGAVEDLVVLLAVGVGTNEVAYQLVDDHDGREDLELQKASRVMRAKKTN